MFLFCIMTFIGSLLFASSFVQYRWLWELECGLHLLTFLSLGLLNSLGLVFQVTWRIWGHSIRACVACPHARSKPIWRKSLLFFFFVRWLLLMLIFLNDLLQCKANFSGLLPIFSNTTTATFTQSLGSPRFSPIFELLHSTLAVSSHL